MEYDKFNNINTHSNVLPHLLLKNLLKRQQVKFNINGGRNNIIGGLNTKFTAFIPF